MEQSWRWTLGMVYVIAVAVIWIVASFVVQSVVGAGVSPFLITYICNSLFVIYIPIVEGRRYGERWLKRKWDESQSEDQKMGVEKENLLLETVNASNLDLDTTDSEKIVSSPSSEGREVSVVEVGREDDEPQEPHNREWTRLEIAKVGLLICPFWFIAQFTFNLSLKYTTVTSNTILSSSSSLFTFLVSLCVLNEKFTWLKLSSVLLCMLGTIIVSLADASSSGFVYNAGWGDLLCLVSALLYAIYSTLIRKNLPDEASGEGKASTALFFGYLGLFNALLLTPVALIVHFTGIETFHRLSPMQLGLILCKGLFDNVLSDYLWAKALLLTTPTAATAGLTIQVPIAAVVDSLRGKVPSPLNLLGAVAVLLGFFGINQPATGCFGEISDSAIGKFDHLKQSTMDDTQQFDSVKQDSASANDVRI